MAKLNKNIFTVCFEQEGAKRVYSSRSFFELTENSVKLTQPTNTELTLAWVLENFTVTEKGFHFYYDLKANSIKHLIESVSTDLQEDRLNESVASHDEITELSEKLSDLEALRKQHKLSNNLVAVNEAESMISTIQNRIQELKKSANYVKYSYVAEENKAFVNNREVSIDGFAEQAFASGHISYKNKPILAAFETAAKNFSLFGNAESVVETSENGIRISTFRAGNRAFVYRVNEETSIKQFNEWSPIKAIDYVAESMGEDLSFMFEDLLESKNELKARIEERLEETYELISFLKSQKDLFAETNRNIPEIKEAEKLINSEIARFEQIAGILENDELTKNDGYLDATIEVDYEGAPAGSEIKVDALDYTSASKADMVTVMINNKPLKVTKNHISLQSGDSI